MSKPEKSRTIEQALREAVHKLPHDQQKAAREKLRKAGVLKDDDKPERKP